MLNKIVCIMMLGELMNISFYHDLGNMKSKTYFYKTVEFKGESFYDSRGVLNDGYTLGISIDTINKSKVPLFNSQPKKDLSSIVWEKKESGISTLLKKREIEKNLLMVMKAKFGISDILKMAPNLIIVVSL